MSLPAAALSVKRKGALDSGSAPHLSLVIICSGYVSYCTDSDHDVQVGSFLNNPAYNSISIQLFAMHHLTLQERSSSTPFYEVVGHGIEIQECSLSSSALRHTHP